jgi:hypothetical protein
MACDDYKNLWEALTDFSNPLDAGVCPFTSDLGAGMGLPLFTLFVFGFIGMGLTIRVQHPSPILVAGILSASVVTATLPGIAAKIMALILFFGLSALGLYIYSRARSTL